MMTNAQELLQLADRVEALTEPCREVDAAIAVTALGWFTIPPRYVGDSVGYGYMEADGTRIHPGHGGDQIMPRYTTSLDAAITLAEIDEAAFIALSDAMVALENNGWAKGEWAKMLPRYITAAALRARASEPVVGATQ